VVLGLHPRGEQPVEFQERGRVVDPGGGEVLAAGVGHLDEELLAHGPEESFDLPPALGSAGGRMHQPHAEFRARPQQPRIDERGAVVHIDPGRDPAGGQRRLQGRSQAHGVLGVTEPITRQQPGVVINKANR
jgi:hypothetical protein